MTAQVTPDQALGVWTASRGIDFEWTWGGVHAGTDTMGEWQHRRWACTLTHEGRRMRVPFHQGMAHTKPPTVGQVLEAVTLDTREFHHGTTFRDWCDEFGLNPDLRASERLYGTCEAQYSRLRYLLGPTLLDAIYEVVDSVNS